MADRRAELREGAQVEQDGSSNGDTPESRVTFSGSTNRSDNPQSGSLAPVDNWTPSACWYEPRSAEEFAKYEFDCLRSLRYSSDISPEASGSTRIRDNAVGVHRDQTHRRDWAMASHRYPMDPPVPLNGIEKARWRYPTSPGIWTW